MTHLSDNWTDFSKPMGVATFQLGKNAPEDLTRVLPTGRRVGKMYWELRLDRRSNLKLIVADEHPLQVLIEMQVQAKKLGERRLCETRRATAVSMWIVIWGASRQERRRLRSCTSSLASTPRTWSIWQSG